MERDQRDGGENAGDGWNDGGVRGEAWIPLVQAAHHKVPLCHDKPRRIPTVEIKYARVALGPTKGGPISNRPDTMVRPDVLSVGWGVVDHLAVATQDN